MSSGTHVGIIGNVSATDPELKASIERTLNEILASRPFAPLVLHYAVGQRAHKIARNYAVSLGKWQIQAHPNGNSSIAEASHVLIVIAAGSETVPGPGASGIWPLVKRARASGRRIIHIPVVGESPKSASKHTGPRISPTSGNGQKRSVAWAISRGKADSETKQVSVKYSRFRRRYRLADSPESRQLWREYKRAATTPLQALTAKKPRVSVPASRSRPNAMGAVPLTPHHIALLRKTNQPDPDVWR